MRKRNKILLIASMTVLCLLMGAWLVLYESSCRMAGLPGGVTNNEKNHGAGTENTENAGMNAAEKSIWEQAEKGLSEASTGISDRGLSEIEDWLTADRVYSHRGSAGQNEHSFEAYDAAIAAGSHNIEQDIVISGDGTLYVSHDLTASAMTGDGRAYANMTDEEIDALERYSGGHILRLSEVFERYGKSVHYVIELKSGDDATIDAFKSEVDRHGVEDCVIAQSLDVSVLERLEEIYPDMPKLLVVKTQGALSEAMESDYVDIVGARVQFVNETNCTEAHERGKKFAGWTLDSEREILNAIEAGADAYFTNDTPLALELERKYRPVKIRKGAKGGTEGGIPEPGAAAGNAPDAGSSGSSACSTLFLASDYQAEDGFDAPADTLKTLLKAADDDGKYPETFVFCGDYTNVGNLHDYQVSPEDAITEIKEVVNEAYEANRNEDKKDDNYGNASYGKDTNAAHKDDVEPEFVFIQGNHDAMTDSITQSGLHEYDNYLIYVLNTENDFPWKQGKVSGCLSKVRRAAKEMNDCFDDLITKGETRPVFIAGHVPLHFTARTSSRHTTGDNLYSSFIFDVVNEAAKKLDIVYMFGHNHSKGWDCYLGGACVYKAEGDRILLPVFNESDVNSDIFKERTLNFTYMNAGYTGYYMNCAPSEYSADPDSAYRAADETLTATVCEIYEDRIEIIRYDANGRHVLGAAGEADPYKGGIDMELIGTEQYSKETQSPAIIYRKKSDSQRIDDAA